MGTILGKKKNYWRGKFITFKDPTLSLLLKNKMKVPKDEKPRSKSVSNNLYSFFNIFFHTARLGGEEQPNFHARTRAFLLSELVACLRIFFKMNNAIGFTRSTRQQQNMFRAPFPKRCDETRVFKSSVFLESCKATLDIPCILQIYNMALEYFFNLKS